MTLARTVFIALLLPLTLAACEDTMSSWGFSLPEGDGTKGKQTFAELKCHACHTVTGHQDLREGIEFEPEMTINLGGVKPAVQTYGDLVSSIINPSHRLALGYPKDMIAEDDGTSKMANYNSVMTVEELVDLVTFLQAQYRLPPYPPTPYGSYYR